MATPKHAAALALKIAVSASLLGYVFAKVGWSALLGVVTRAEPLFILLAFLVAPILILVSVLKWQLLLRAKSIEVPLSQLFSLYLIGNFFNHLLPTNVGGDVVRSYRLGRQTGNLREAVASVFMERLSGLAVLLAFAVISMALNFRLLRNPAIALTLALALVGFSSIVWLILDRRPLASVVSRIRAPGLVGAVARIDRLHQAVQAYRERPGVWPAVIGLSIVFYVVAVVNVYLCCMAFGSQPPVAAVATAVPVILVIAMAPVSLGGVGLQEWGYWIVFDHVGLPGALGLSVALLMRLKMVLVGGCGGLVYARSLVQERQLDKYAEA